MNPPATAGGPFVTRDELWKIREDWREDISELKAEIAIMRSDIATLVRAVEAVAVTANWSRDKIIQIAFGVVALIGTGIIVGVYIVPRVVP